MLGDRLRNVRNQKGLSQGQISEYAGVSQSTLSDLERGEISPKTIDAVVNLAAYFECSADYLLGLTDDPRPADKRSWTPESQAAVDLIDSLPAAKRAAAIAVLKAAIELGRIEDETNLEPVVARDGGGVTIDSETNIGPQEDLIAEKNRLLAFTDKMFPPDVALEVRRLVESGQGFTDADIERIISASNQRTLRQGSELFKNA